MRGAGASGSGRHVVRWLGLKKRPVEEPVVVEEAGPLPPLPPALNLLVPDVAGVTSFHLRQFLSTEEAAEFVKGLPSLSGLYAFWGLHTTPGQTLNGEAIVLIRSAEGSDTVYVVSFVDLESALAFARFEVKRGMNPALLLIYWAEIVDIQATDEGVRFIPDSPPRPLAYAPPYQPVPGPWAESGLELPPGPAAAHAAAPSLRKMPPPPEPEWERETAERFEQFVAEVRIEPPAPGPEPETAPHPERVAAEAGPAAAREPEPATLEEPVAAGEAEPMASPEPEPTEIRGPEHEAVSEPEPVADFEPEQASLEAQREPAPAEGLEPVALTQPVQEAEREPIEVEEAGPAPVAEPEPVALEKPQPASLSEPEQETAEASPLPAAEELDIEREAREFIEEAQATEPAAEAPPLEEAPAAAPATLSAGAQGVAIPKQAAASEAPSQETGAGETLEPDLVKEVEKILRVKRWDKRETPFRGFNSPPGRF